MLTVYLAVTLSVLLLLGITAAAVFKNQYINEQEAELRREAEEINTILTEKYIDSEKRLVATEELRTIARKYDALIQVVDLTGTKMSFMHPDSEEKWAAIDGVDLSELASSVIRDGGVTVTMNLYRDMTKLNTMTLMRPVVGTGGENEGVILLHVDMSDVNRSIGQVYLDVLLCGCVAVLLAVFALSYITGRITRPVLKMNRIVKRYTHGEFDLRVPVVSDDEVGELAETFNTMADELATLETARRSFVANVSHELRSPLTSMRGFLAAMQDGTIAPEDYRKYLGIVIDENNRMTEMVNDLLDLARIESGQTVITPEVFDVGDLIARTLLTFEARLNNKHMDADVSVDEKCYAEADPSQIAQVLRNLIDNAVKFSKDGGLLTISARCERQSVIVSVRDEGCGMAKEDLPHIFDRFYKAEKAHTPKDGSGTGLGLAIVKCILDAHGEHITVTSEQGKGTEFCFTLKRSQKPPKPKKRPGADAQKPDSQSKKAQKTDAQGQIAQKAEEQKPTASPEQGTP